MKGNATKKELIAFLVISFLITYVIDFWALINGGIDHNPVMAIQMIIPALTAVLLVFIFRSKHKIQDLGLRFKFNVFIWKGPFVVFFIIVFVSILSILIEPSYLLSFNEIINGIHKSSLPIDIGNSYADIFILLFINIIIGTIINLPIFLGEEIGWRAYMTPRLIELFGRRGHLISGVIWALWHVLLIVMGLNYPGYPILGNVMMIAFCIPVGFILQYYYYKSGSVLVAALMHGMMNRTAMTIMMFFVNSKSTLLPLIIGPVGIISIIAFWCYAIYLFFNLKQSIWNGHNAQVYGTFQIK